MAYLFEKRGVVVVDAGRWSEDDLVAAIDAGAEDIAIDEDVYEIVAAPAELPAVRAALEEAGVDVESAEVVQRRRLACPSRRRRPRACCASSTRSRRTTTSMPSTRTSTSTPTCWNASPAEPAGGAERPQAAAAPLWRVR